MRYFFAAVMVVCLWALFHSALLAFGAGFALLLYLDSKKEGRKWVWLAGLLIIASIFAAGHMGLIETLPPRVQEAIKFKTKGTPEAFYQAMESNRPFESPDAEGEDEGKETGEGESPKQPPESALTRHIRAYIEAGFPPDADYQHPQAWALETQARILREIDKGEEELAQTQASITEYQEVRLAPFFKKKDDGSGYERDADTPPPVYRIKTMPKVEIDPSTGFPMRDPDTGSMMAVQVENPDTGEWETVMLDYWVECDDDEFRVDLTLPVYVAYNRAMVTGMPSRMVAIAQQQQNEHGKWVWKYGFVEFDKIEGVVSERSVRGRDIRTASAVPPKSVHPKSDSIMVKPGDIQDPNTWTFSRVIPDYGEVFYLTFPNALDYSKVRVWTSVEEIEEPTQRASDEEPVYQLASLRAVAPTSDGRYYSPIRIVESNRYDMRLAFVAVSDEAVKVEIKKVR